MVKKKNDMNHKGIYYTMYLNGGKKSESESKQIVLLRKNKKFSSDLILLSKGTQI